MKALVLQDIGKLCAETRDIPSVQPAEALVRVLYCGICRTDAKMWRHGHRDLVLPRVPGHEVAARDEKTGQRYVLWPGKACGRCIHCSRGSENLCVNMQVMGFHRDGGFADYVVMPADALITIPETLGGPVACFSEPLACALNALDQAGMSPGSRVLIYGGGTVGLLTALAVQYEGGEPLVVETSSTKLQKSSPFRTTTKIRAGETPGAECFDIIINAAPSVETFTQAIPLLRQGGCYCLFSGLPATETVPVSVINDIHYRQLHVVGAYGCTRRQMERAVRILDSRGGAAELLIEESITLEQAADAVAKTAAGETFRFIISM